MKRHAKKQTRWTIKDLLEWTTEYFQNKGIGTARLDAEVLLAHALGVDRLYLYLNLERPLSSSERAAYRSLVRRRSSREPVALITGRKEFWSLCFRVAPGILIPRPETEILVEGVVDEIRDKPAPWVLEVGTGAGAIAVAVLRENPRARILATDIDPRALQLARRNAEEHLVRESLDLAASDLLEAVRPGAGFDVVCSNPPYVPGAAIPHLEPEIRDYEPHRALDGGPNGLSVIRRLAVQAARVLRKGGALMMEVGDGQAHSVGRVMTESAGFRDIKTFRDLSGVQRVVKGRL